MHYLLVNSLQTVLHFYTCRFMDYGFFAFCYQDCPIEQRQNYLMALSTFPCSRISKLIKGFKVDYLIFGIYTLCVRTLVAGVLVPLLLRMT